MLSFVFNDKVYGINQYDSINNLTAREDLLQLPLYAWQELFKMKDGICLDYLLKSVLEHKIDFYDKSDSVNSFIYKNNKYWLDKQQRSCIKNVAQGNLETMELILGDSSAIFPSKTVDKFIQDLETYSYKCYVTTAKHKQNIQNLQTIEDFINYDYTTGYPEKIILE